uniref:Late embryogenesis abundant protein LEA-2 subgroup domain-containing protein n=1 Tax=Davidia involucrata TaxID=16924 RepID=A0A5B7BR14_DAVIN
MAEKQHQQAYPLAPANGYFRSDQEANSEHSRELRRKKRMKCLLYVVAFAVFQTGIILLFALTVMKIKTPKFRVRTATFEGLESTTNSSFNIRMNVELGVKNTNFGRYKFDTSTITFFYKNTQVGIATVPNARARLRSTKKFTVLVSLASTTLPSNSELGNDISSGVLPLTSRSTLQGKVQLFKVMKKKKSTQMNCSMGINLSSGVLQNVVCR